MRAVRIDYHVSVLVIGVSAFGSHALVPAVHATHGVGVNREGQVLMNADHVATAVEPLPSTALV